MAMKSHKKRVRIRKKPSNLAGERSSYETIANMYESLAEYENAIEYYKKHLRVCQDTSDLTGEGWSYGQIGNVYHSLGKFEEAIEYHKKHLSICIKTGNLEGEGRCYGNTAVVYSCLGRYKKAMKYFKKQLRICRKTGDLVGEGTLYGNVGNLYQQRGQCEEAMNYHKKHLRLSKETRDIAGEVRSYGNIGSVYFSMGEYATAVEYIKKHLRVCQTTGDKEGEGKSCGNMGNVYASLGKFQEAVEYFKKQLFICKEIGDLVGEGSSNANLGCVHGSLGQYQEAMKYHIKGLRLFQETGDLVGEGKSYCNIGNVFLYLHRYEWAMVYHKKDLHICQETGDLAGSGKSYGSIGNVYQSLGQYEEAMECYKKHLCTCKITGDVVGKGIACYNIGHLCWSVGSLHAAEVNLKESLRCVEQVFNSLRQQDDYKVSIVDTYVSTYHLLTDVSIALGKQEEALLVSERGRSQALRDKLTMKYGLPPAGEGSNLPIEDVSSLASSSDTAFLFLSLSETKLSIFVLQRGRELCYKEKEHYAFAFCGNSECSSANLRNTITLYVNNIIQDANQFLNSGQTKLCEDRSMNQDQDLYPKHHPALDENATTLLSSYRQGPTDHSDKNSTRESHPEQTQAKQSKQKQNSETTMPEKERNDDQNGNDPFNKLYQILIAPVEEALTKPEIVIIPDGSLFFVPFAALKAKDQTFLSVTKRIRIGPSLTTLKLLKECPVEKHCKTGALIVGGPIAGEVLFRGEKKSFSDLPFARREAHMIAHILGERPLTGSSATKNEVKRRLKEGVAIIHIATHGIAATGELLLAPEPRVGKEIPEEEDYMLTMKDIYSCGINAQLVVLSCCHSGHGEIKAEGVVGLTRAFLAAGARSVLASLWAIDDAATSCLMKHFYQNLKSGESACTSLQQAMTEMRKTREWSHPYYWAPFFIVGDDITVDV